MDLDRATYEANTRPMLSHINVGTGEDISIADLARLVADVTRFRGRIAFDPSKPDGTPRKLMDVSRLVAIGGRARTPLREGLEQTYAGFTSADNLRNQ